MGTDGKHLIAAAPIFHSRTRHLEHPARIRGGIHRHDGQSRADNSEAKFTELEVRANTGLGSEKATLH
jgi:hypothetical protein